MATFTLSKIIKKLTPKLSKSTVGLLITTALLCAAGVVLSFTGIGAFVGAALLTLGISQLVAQIITIAAFGVVGGLIGAGIAKLGAFLVGKCQKDISDSDFSFNDSVQSTTTAITNQISNHQKTRANYAIINLHFRGSVGNSTIILSSHDSFETFQRKIELVCGISGKAQQISLTDGKLITNNGAHNTLPFEIWRDDQFEKNYSGDLTVTDISLSLSVGELSTNPGNSTKTSIPGMGY